MGQEGSAGAPARAVRPHAWLSLAILVGVFLAGLAVSTQPPGWSTLVLYELPGLLMVVVIVVSVRVQRPANATPWLLLALGVGLSVLADFVWDGAAALSIDPDRFGHLSDVCYLLAYPVYLVAALGFLGARAIRRDITLLVDGAIFALAGWLALWVLLVQPQLTTGGLSIWDWLPTVLYPPLDLLVLVVVWRVGRGDVRRTAPWWLLFLAFAIMFVADVLYAVLAMPDAGGVSDALVLGWLMTYACMAAAAAHPGMRFLVADPDPLVRGTDRVRVVGVGLALGAPLILAVAAPSQLREEAGVVLLAGAVIVVLSVVRFLTAAGRDRRAEAALAYRATHDPLTGLANRSALLDHLDRATRRAARRGDSCAVVFVDLDDFKIVNDSLGHGTGDELLQAVAGRLRSFARGDECVARLGGDEFVVVLEGLSGTAAATGAAQRLAGIFIEPFSLRAGDFHVSASVGVVTDAERRVGESEALLRDADLAMYEAKGADSQRIGIYESTMHERAIGRLELKNALRRALTNDEFRLVYQPIFDTVTGAPIAMEALVRWEHDGVTVEPFDFISVAESSGAIIDIGAWVLRTAARDLAALDDQDLCVTVNVSPRQLTRPEFAGETVAAVRAVGLGPARVILEIVESALVEPDPTVDTNLEALGAAGFPMAIDDFGTGYSSLAYVKRLAVDWIKVDRMFVQDLGDDSSDEALVRAIVRMADELDLKVIAEGVETEQQLEVLTALGCHAVQGFLLARPRPIAETLDALRATGGTLRSGAGSG